MQPLESLEKSLENIVLPDRASDPCLLQYGNSSLAAKLAWTPARAYKICFYTNRDSLTEASFKNSCIPVHTSAVQWTGGNCQDHGFARKATIVAQRLR